jgi:hypothetical protein
MHIPTICLDDLEVLINPNNNKTIIINGTLKNFSSEGFNKGLCERKFRYELILPCV